MLERTTKFIIFTHSGSCVRAASISCVWYMRKMVSLLFIKPTKIHESKIQTLISTTKCVCLCAVVVDPFEFLWNLISAVGTFCTLTQFRFGLLLGFDCWFVSIFRTTVILRRNNWSTHGFSMVRVRCESERVHYFRCLHRVINLQQNANRLCMNCLFHQS